MTKNGITSASGSIGKPISCTTPSPQIADITPVSVGRSAPRQSWKYMYSRIHKKIVHPPKMYQTSPV